jgi:hypothetical protein
MPAFRLDQNVIVDLCEPEPGLVTHCPERWPLDMLWNSAGTDHDIARA